MATMDLAMAAARAALRSLGGGSAMLRLPAGGSAEGVAGLGMSAPVWSDVDLSPVLVRYSGADMEVLVEAQTLEEAGGCAGEELVTLLTTSARIHVNSATYKIKTVRAETLGSSAYLFRLGLEG